MSNWKTKILFRVIFLVSAISSFAFAGGQMPFLFTNIHVHVGGGGGGSASLSFSPKLPTANFYTDGPQTFTLSNSGTAAAAGLSFDLPTGVGPTFNGFYISSTTCGASLAAGASCEIIIDFGHWSLTGVNSGSLTATAGAVSKTLLGLYWDDGGGI